MKKAYIVLAILATMYGSLHAADVNITFDGKQKLYFNSSPSWIPSPKWDEYGATFSAYFYGTSGNKFAGKAEQIDGKIYAVTVPAGSWHHVIFTRHAPSTTIFDFDSDHGFWSESIPIALKQYQWDNYISEFNLKGDDGASEPYCEWNKLYSERPKNSTTPAALAAYWGLTIENISVCDNSEGDPFTLTPNTIDKGEGKYEYNYDMRAHAWFKTTNNGTTWTNVDGKGGVRNSDQEGEMNYNDEKVGAKNSVTYYYLYAKEANDQRLICVSVNKDCKVSCEITSFEITPTAVNVGDNTYTMDGIVAFTKAEGSLIIECDGKQATIATPESPQAFSLPGLTADGQPESFRAYFSNAGSCEMIKNTTAPLPTSDATTHPDQTIAPLDELTLTPTADGTDTWEWTFGEEIVKQSPAADNKCPVTTYDYDTTVTYVYTEYNPLPTLPTNLMYNGDFEDVSVPFHWHTEYKNSNVLNSNKIWDGTTADRKNIYDLPAFAHSYGYFGVATNANTYWKLMSRRGPKDGLYMAVIDGDEVADRQAWYASTSDNPNLKLTRGTTYLFSFWVANINNFGELINNGRQNCAKLQFHIKCHSVDDNTWYEADLGQPIDLNEAKYMDLNWHQNSSTFSTRAYFGKDFDADNVTISVVDKTNTGLTIGNDFALDDIQFRAISVVSKSIKAREFFTVKFYEAPVVVEQPVIAITQTPACGNTDFTMNVTVSYSMLNNKYPVTLQLTDNVYGPLFATPITINPATNPTSITLTLPTATYAMLVADGAVHTLTAKLTRLDGAGVDKGGQNSNTYTSPGIPAIKTPVVTITEPACDKTTFDIQVATEYKAFKGTQLHYEWDGSEWTNADNPALSYKELTWQTATGKLKDLPADGQNHTLRVYSDNATLDCEYSFSAVAAPAMPAIDTVQTAFSAPACTDLTTTLTFDLDYTYQQGTLTYWVDAMAPQTATYSVADKTKQTLTGLTFAGIPADGKNNHVLHVSFDGANSCVKSYNLPAVPFSPVISSVVVSGVPAVLDCEETQYNISVSVSMPYDATGKDIVITYAGKDSTLAVTANPMVASLPMTISDATNQTVSAHYSDSPACITTSAPFDDPARSAIDTVQTAFSAPACTDLTTTLTFDLDYTYQQGTLTYWVDDMTPQTATYSVADKTKQTLTGLTFAGIPADGKNNHILHVSFDGTNSCVKSYNLPAVPFSPVISSVVVSGVPATVLCEEKDYSFTVTITTPYDATGRNIVLSGSKDTTVAATGTSTVVTIKKTDIGGDAQAVTAALEATPTCTKSSDPFTPPVRTSCNKWYDDICEGENYTLHGFNIINPSVGKHSYSHPDNIYDSLFLTVHAMPAISIAPVGIICDSEAQIAMPFTVVNGAPDTYDIAIGSTHYAGTVSGTDITFAMAPELVAGDYTAVVTAGTLGTDCSSQVTVNFTIADGSHLFSKWTDVLFVDNSEGRFVSYQWYEDGYLMSGETQQRLYNPDGLTGSYYCRMTTTDGKTIYTCEQAFDKVTPSRTANSSTPAAAPAVYDTMGRPVQGTPRNGIYIMIEERDGERFVKKVLIHE